MGVERNGRVQRSHFKPGFGDQGIRKIIGQSQPVHEFQLFLQQGDPLFQISLRVGIHRQRDGARFH